jgi:carbamoyl-phosphate synthase/aspartate carbamoyltransferase
LISIVLRHPQGDSVEIAAKAADGPIINAGNGPREHPTQAFLDLFTIREELGTVNGLTITFTGDLKYGRTVHSLCELLRHYNVSIQLAAPASLAIPAKVRAALQARGQLILESDRLTPEMIAKTDVLYCTRVQKERFEDPELYEEVKDVFVVDGKTLKQAKKNMIVMHPLPRNQELSEEVDDDPRAAYYRQVRCCAIFDVCWERLLTFDYRCATACLSAWLCSLSSWRPRKACSACEVEEGVCLLIIHSAGVAAVSR